MKSVTVLTPTVASDKLLDAVKSVQAQTYPNVQHHFVIDGQEYNAKFNNMMLSHGITRNMTYDFLTNNVGANGFYGHRIYAAFGHLINSDYICFLDEDNWFEPDHVETLVNGLEQEKDLAFLYSLRKIYSPDREYICNDDCESLGHWPTWVSTPPMVANEFLVDTSSYCFRRETLIQTGHLWHSGWGGDRRYLNLMRQHNFRYGTTGKYTLCYRLDGNEGSVNADFFKAGNEFMNKQYNGVFPWRI